jgi:2-aminoadipate transaminase
MNVIPESFIREILKVATRPDMISFAGGLPNQELFPVTELAAAAEKVIGSDGKSIFQYNVTEGYMPLREMLADLETRKSGKLVTPEEILICSGSQQGLDLTGKVILNPNDKVLVEAPTYLGALQAFSAYQPEFRSIDLQSDGVDTDELKKLLTLYSPRMFYIIPEHQNPGSVTYSDEKRKAVAGILKNSDAIIVEDSAYRELSFNGESGISVRTLLPDNTIQLNSFSKIISPGLRLGWAVASAEIIRKMTVAKQASDLHSSIFTQRVLFQFLLDNNLENHLNKIRQFYKNQCDHMISLIKKYLPENVKYRTPSGGMFIWLELPEPVDSKQLLQECIKENLVFVPGGSFYLNEGDGKRFIRINFSASSAEAMERGMEILGRNIINLQRN